MRSGNTREEPNLPPIPSLGGDLPKNVEEYPVTVVSCYGCGHAQVREFRAGDYAFKKIPDHACPKCGKADVLYVKAVYAERRKKTRERAD
ncbi:MAG: hypothetical protein Kow0069_24600 [Promethearchaeota archaeon]